MGKSSQLQPHRNSGKQLLPFCSDPSEILPTRLVSRHSSLSGVLLSWRVFDTQIGSFQEMTPVCRQVSTHTESRVTLLYRCLSTVKNKKVVTVICLVRMDQMAPHEAKLLLHNPLRSFFHWNPKAVARPARSPHFVWSTKEQSSEGRRFFRWNLGVGGGAEAITCPGGGGQ